ncbi:MAG: gamma-glutamyltransferase family protein [Phenylobacterium sp.]|nr:MAG: gamma-glutamyltransferase family protein [Phenylobacterium sp.]
MTRLGFPGDLTTRPPWPKRRSFPVVGRRGMAAGAHPLIVSTALGVLQSGGNAVDAAVAAGLTAAVVMPEMCGLGGDLFAIVHPGPGAEPLAFLGSGAAPAAASLAMVRAKAERGVDGGERMPLRGGLSISTPGMVAGYRELLARFGSRDFGRLAEPAIRYAEEGAPLSLLAAHVLSLFRPVLESHAPTAAVFLPGGSPPRAGALLPQNDLAATLRTLAREGPEAFYRGPLAVRIAEGVQAAGGALGEADLAAHATVVEAPIATAYRGRTVLQTGLPSQGFLMLEALNIVEPVPAETLAAGGAEAVHLMAEALKAAYADRLAYARDPASGPTPLGRLLSKAWAADRFARIDPQRASGAPAPALQDGDTTYLCVADADGMMVSLIQSVSSAFGSGIVAGDTGVLMNNRAGRGFELDPSSPNLYAPGKKTMHTLNCWLILDEDGTPAVVGGTPGGDGQPQWGLQLVSSLVDAGLDVQLACEAPRWQVWPGTDPHDRPNPYRLQIESRIGEVALAGLTARGHVLESWGAWGGLGAAQLIARDPATGVLMGGSDPRVEGLALGF